MTSSSSPTPSGRPTWLPGRRVLLWIAAAFAIGLLLFLLVFLKGRDDDFYRHGDEAPPTAATPRYTPLPAPLGDAEGASGLGDVPEPVEDGDGRPQLVETAPPPAPPETDTPTPDSDSVPPATPVATSVPRPLPGQSPPPSYPSRSLRRGETGTVIIQATVGVDGRPRNVDVARSSGSRRLDRAARKAVQDWRFQPATAEGQPIEASVNIPIDFQR